MTGRLILLLVARTLPRTSCSPPPTGAPDRALFAVGETRWSVADAVAGGFGAPGRSPRPGSGGTGSRSCRRAGRS